MSSGELAALSENVWCSCGAGAMLALTLTDVPTAHVGSCETTCAADAWLCTGASEDFTICADSDLSQM